MPIQSPSNLLKDILIYYRRFMQPALSEEESAVVIYWLIEKALGLTKAKVLLDTQRRLSESEILKIHFLCKRVSLGEPVQYVMGEGWFYGRSYEVGKGVLIPRPETEELVEEAIKRIGFGSMVIDLCTGSGCIASTIALERQDTRVKAIEIDKTAIGYARKNAERLSARVDFIEGDVLNIDSLPNDQFDLIISNPPYVRESEIALMESRVIDWEPSLALFVTDEDPLIFYRSIGLYAKRCLRPGGIIALEINENLGSEVVSLFQGLDFEIVELKLDMRGKTRMAFIS